MKKNRYSQKKSENGSTFSDREKWLLRLNNQLQHHKNMKLLCNRIGFFPIPSSRYEKSVISFFHTLLNSNKNNVLPTKLSSLPKKGWVDVKIDLKMKLSVVLLIFGTFVLQANSTYSQKKISLNLTNVTIERLLDEIESRTDFRFIYSTEDIDIDRRVAVVARRQSVDVILNDVFAGTKTAFSIDEGQIFLLKDNNKKPSLEKILSQDPIRIIGMVTNNEGVPLSGATVLEKGTTNGTQTDFDGNFSISVADQTAFLVISYVGFATIEIPVGSQTQLNIILEESASSLDEVVVVGYGIQKKANLSGSVSSISGNIISERPAPNLQNLLQGRISGLDIVQSTGEPGRDNASFNVRGLGSFGASSSPLILVNGVIASIGNLAPEDIENVTVLKDASSAAIYGARAANGVILITTKKGKAGNNVIEYSGSYGLSRATFQPDLITDSPTYMQMYNEANIRRGSVPIYTQEQIDLYRANPNSQQYPSFDWVDYVLGTGPIANHRLGFSGGTENTTYNVSFSHLDQEGITKGYDYKRYNALMDFETKIHKRVKVGTNINFSFQDAVAPWLTNDDLLLLAFAAAPTFQPFLPDGSGRLANRDFTTTGGNNRTVEEVYNTGSQTTKNYNVNAQAFTKVDIFKGLTWNSKAALTFFNQDYKNRQFPTMSYAYQPNESGEFVQIANGNPGFTGLRQSSSRNLTKTFYTTLNFTKTFGADHNFAALGGYEQQDNRSANLNGARFNFPNNTLNELNGSTSLNQTTGGTATEWALQSYFGRVNYDYKGIYFLEGNIRYDGTSRVTPENRWGTFGGGSAAWRISKESFMEDVDWLSNLKLRASYGELGNQEIGNYPYQDILSVSTYPFSSLSSSAQLTRLTDKNLSWERTATTDFGLDIELFQGMLGATVDWYKKSTTGILESRRDQPASLGLSAPTVNAGSLENKGIELELYHRNSIGAFDYGANVLFHRFRNKVTRVLAESEGTVEIGQPYNNLFVYDWIGVFQSQDEIDNSPTQPNSGVLKPGDLKIRDVDGNGNVGPEDRIRISRFPDYTYSFGLNAGYKGLNISAFFQGVEGINLQVSDWGIDPFFQGAAPNKSFLNAWSSTNPSNTVPAVYVNGYSGVEGYSSTYHIQDASYLRLKNVNISYTFPKRILDMIYLKGLVIYVSGDNLITWTNYEGSDPERSGSGRFAQFPQLRIITTGLKLKL